jgi:LacI family transcriptional regulator
MATRATTQRSDAVTLQTVADAAGVSRMAVSLALRDRPGIKPSTRQRIKAMAIRLGYRPDPLVSIYQAQVRARRRARYEANIIWINDHPQDDFWRSLPWMAGYLEGASRRADELGFKLELIHRADLAGNRAHSMERLTRVLHSRGIFGVILPWLHSTEHASLDWSGFAVAMIGKNVGYSGTDARASTLPLYHHANPDVVYNLQLAFRVLRNRGCRRIGLAFDRLNDRLSESQQRGCFLIEQEDAPRKDRVPPLVVPHFSDSSSRAQLLRWFDRYRPDGILLYDTGVIESLRCYGGGGLEGVRFAELNLTAGMSGLSGVDTRHELIGAAAVDLVVSQLHRSERGRPEAPREILIKGVWRDGSPR